MLEPTVTASWTSDRPSRQLDEDGHTAEAYHTARPLFNVGAEKSLSIVISDVYEPGNDLWLVKVPDDMQTYDSLRFSTPLDLSPDDAQIDHSLRRSAPLVISSSQIHIEKMPRDGLCLFHAIAFWLAKFGCTDNGSLIRQIVATFIDCNPRFEVAGYPLHYWVAIDSETSVSEYVARLISGVLWGGEIEIKLICHMYSVDIAVYQETDDGERFQRVHYFPADAAPRGVVKLLYVGGNHYDALGEPRQSNVNEIRSATNSDDFIIQDSDDENFFERRQTDYFDKINRAVVSRFQER